MAKSIHIFKSFEEQEKFHQRLMVQSTVAERFRKLYLMQQMHFLLHPVAGKSRKIQIGKWKNLEELGNQENK
jgi:hypothetical protein